VIGSLAGDIGNHVVHFILSGDGRAVLPFAPFYNHGRPMPLPKIDIAFVVSCAWVDCTGPQRPALAGPVSAMRVPNISDGTEIRRLSHALYFPVQRGARFSAKANGPST
jgi:hypothetical protein